MKLKRIIIVAMLFQISLQATSEQDTLLITPESGLINGSIIKPYTNKWKVTYVTSEGKLVPNKFWTDYGQIIELNGEKYFHRVQDLYDPQMNLQDTWINMVEHESLVPISSSTLKPNGLFSYVQCEGNVAKLQTNMTSKDTTVVQSELDFGQKAYDWSLYGMLLVGLPFKEGLIAKMPIIGTDSLEWLVANVMSKEILLLPNNEKVTTWKVHTNRKLIFWISQSAPYVIKLELKLQGGAKLLWEVI